MMTRLLERLKMPLARKLSLIFFLLFFVGFTLFILVSYRSTDYYLLSREKEAVRQTIASVEARLAQTASPLTLGNLTEILYKNATTDDLIESEEGYHILREERDITNMLYANEFLYIYGTDKKILFTTDASGHSPKLAAVDQLTMTEVNGRQGYVLSQPIVSDVTNQTIGYVELFHDLELYHVMRQRLFLFLLLIELIGTGLALLIIHFASRSFLRPVYRLRQLMLAISENPSQLTERSNIQTGDEIEDLSVIFDKMLDKVQEYSDLQSRFVSDVSHELRTPVAVIKGHLGLLQRWGKNDPAILEESLQASSEEAERMSIMINDMLDMIRVQGSFEQHLQDQADLSKSVSTVVHNFQVMHPSFNFSWEEVSDLPLARIYKVHFEQAVTILMDNAVKYSPQVKDIRLTLTEKEDFLALSIQDRGEGISQDDIRHIFERFYRTDKSRNRTSTQAGLGIGLSILKQITDAYGCHMEVTSQLGEGTCFVLCIPKAI